MTATLGPEASARREATGTCPDGCAPHDPCPVCRELGNRTSRPEASCPRCAGPLGDEPCLDHHPACERRDCTCPTVCPGCCAACHQNRH